MTGSRRKRFVSSKVSDNLNEVSHLKKQEGVPLKKKKKKSIFLLMERWATEREVTEGAKPPVSLLSEVREGTEHHTAPPPPDH